MDKITFDPPLSPDEQVRWQHAQNTIAHLLTLNTSNGKTSPFILLFMGALPRGDSTPVANGTPPETHYDNNPGLIPMCGMTTKASLVFSSAGVPTYLYKVDYDDKPVWYTTIAGNDDWINKGQVRTNYELTRGYNFN